MTHQLGDRIRSTRTGRVGYVIALGDSLIRVQFAGAAQPEWVADDSVESLPEADLRYLAPAEFGRALTAYKLSSQLSDVVYAYLASRTHFRPYQFLPVLRFLASPTRRLLIADEVGLGKTIEAGLIWLELAARQQADRVLVICPPHLREKWRRELSDRFDIHVRVIETGRHLDSEIRELEQHPERIDQPRTWIVSLNLIAAPYDLGPRDSGALKLTRCEMMAEEAIDWDLVIVDEAHHARNPGTRRHDALASLSEIIEAELFLTATPLNLGTPDLFNLLRLLHPDRFRSFDAFGSELEPARHVTSAMRSIRAADRRAVLTDLEQLGRGSIGRRLAATRAYREATGLLNDPHCLESSRTVALLERAIRDLHPLSGVFTRTRKRDLTEPFALREARRVNVRWTEVEHRLYKAVKDHARAANPDSPFAIVMPARQSASCLQAMAQRVREGDWTFDLAELEELDRGMTGKYLQSRSAATFRAVMEATQALGDTDTKYDGFHRILQTLFDEGVEQVLVFSFFLRTIDYLHRRLATDGYTVQKIHGGVPLPDRQDIIDRFRSGEMQILLSSEVGSEGLDFEFCQCVVNYDLPWNPMVVEQRIGRLDRFGQQHEKVLIVNFEIPGTIETEIFDRLYQRIGVFEASIGELDDILGDEIEESAFRLATNVRLTEREQEEQIRRLAINFEKRRQTIEDLDSHRELLAAAEELLGEQLEEIRTSGRYIDPSELQRLVQGYLAKHYPRTKWALTPRGDWEVTLDRRLADSGGPLGEAMNRPALRPFRDRAAMGAPVYCTFDSGLASRERKADFLTSRHAFVKAIADLETPQLFPIFTALQCQAGRLDPGRYVVSVLEAVVRGIDQKRHLVPIAVELRSGERSPEVEKNLLGLVATDEVGPAETFPSGSQLTSARARLQQLAAEERLQILEEARIDNDLVYERRWQAVKATYEPKIEAIRGILDRTRGRRTEAANQARLTRAELRYSEALSQLEAARTPDVALRDVGIIVLDVLPHGAQPPG